MATCYSEGRSAVTTYRVAVLHINTTSCQCRYDKFNKDLSFVPRSCFLLSVCCWIIAVHCSLLSIWFRFGIAVLDFPLLVFCVFRFKSSPSHVCYHSDDGVPNGGGQFSYARHPVWTHVSALPPPFPQRTATMCFKK